MTNIPGDKVLLDSDALVAKLEEADAWHKKSLEIFARLIQNKTVFYIAATTISEVVTTIQRRYNRPKLSTDLFHQLLAEEINIVPVDREVLAVAYEYFTVSRSKKNTTFDVINMAVFKKYDLDAIFSFDNFYKKSGLKLVVL